MKLGQLISTAQTHINQTWNRVNRMRNEGCIEFDIALYRIKRARILIPMLLSIVTFRKSIHYNKKDDILLLTLRVSDYNIKAKNKDPLKLYFDFFVELYEDGLSPLLELGDGFIKLTISSNI